MHHLAAASADNLSSGSGFHGVPGVLGGILAVFLAKWIIGRVQVDIPPSDGSAKVLRYHRAYSIIGWTGMLLSIFCIAGVSLSGEPPLTLVLCLVIFGLLLLSSFALTATYHRSSITWHPDSGEIRWHPLWGAPFGFTWQDVKSIRYSANGQWWRLRLHDGRNVRVGIMMHGATALMATLAANTGLVVPSPDARHPFPTSIPRPPQG